MDTIRSFLAFPISSNLKESLRDILNDLQQTRADVKWVGLENIHLTLKFLGDIEESGLEKISSVLSGSCCRFDPRVYFIGMVAMHNNHNLFTTFIQGVQ